MQSPLVRVLATALAAAVPLPPRAHRWKPGVRSERGQVIVLMIAFLPVLLGGAAMVLDVGSWYRADKAAQAAADASALAGAQGLQAGTDVATAIAEEYAAKNGGGEIEISFATRVVPNDVIKVTVKRPAPGFLSKLFGVDSVNVNALAKARAPAFPAELATSRRSPSASSIPCCNASASTTRRR